MFYIYTQMYLENNELTLKAQVHSKNNLLSIEPEKSDKPIKKSLSKIGWLIRKLWIF